MVESKRLCEIEISSNIFHDRYKYPILVIGNPDEINDMRKNSNNIVIAYDDNADLDKYPTNNPVMWDMARYTGPFTRSNYRELLGYYDDLSFDYKGYEFIKELIYSLAYYQKQNDIKQMSVNDTWNVYRKIYSKKH